MSFRCLDLFCGAGGMSVGLHRAGFEMVGVDILPQKNYPFEFHQADAMKFPLDGFSFIHASPPCQRYTQAAASQRNRGKEYPDLVAPVRARLKASGVPWMIENTPGAPLINPVIICGSMFNLRVIRHRLFEMSINSLIMVPECNHHPLPISVVGNGTPTWNRAKNGGKCFSIQECRDAMGINWMNRRELSQAIPPAYGEYLGRHIMDYLLAV